VTRIVLTFTDMEFARVAGSATARNLTARDYCKIVVMDSTYGHGTNTLPLAGQFEIGAALRDKREG
jgi:hypothetical protein